MRREPVKITASEIIEHLHNGVTRCIGDNLYDPERGSIEEKYNLSKKEVALLFSHPVLKGLKVVVPKKDAFEFVDDVTINAKNNDKTDVEPSVTLPKYGVRKEDKVANKITAADIAV